MKSDPVHLQRIIGYEFKNQELLKEALTHRSFAEEHNIRYDNQRLEFLGDAVLQILLSLELFTRYAQYDEGVLTRLRSALANQTSLAELANRIELGKALLLGHGEMELGGNLRESTLSDAMEALIAAVMLDSDFQTVQNVFLKLIRREWPDPEELLQNLNPKGTLQEYCQKRFGITPVYELLSVTGPDHTPVFTVRVKLGTRILAEGSAAKRRNAEMAAAKKVLDSLETIFPEKK